jgi:hypothetical protein
MIAKRGKPGNFFQIAKMGVAPSIQYLYYDLTFIVLLLNLFEFGKNVVIIVEK